MRLPTCMRGHRLAWLWVLMIVFAIANRSAVGGILVKFDTLDYSVAPGGSISGQVLIDGDGATAPVDAVPSGLFSFGVKITFATSNAAPGSVTVVPAIDYLGTVAGAETTLSPGLEAAKGNVEYTAFIPYPGAELMEFTLTNLAGPGTHYALTLALNNSLGPTENVFIDGTGTTLDSGITFGTASVTVTPEPATLSCMLLAAMLLTRRPQKWVPCIAG
jgi:hypothetical protein